MCPVALRFFSVKFLVKRYTSVSLNTYKLAIVTTQNDGLNNSAVRLYRVLELFESGAVVPFLIACRAERHIKLVRCRVLSIHLQKFPDAWIIAVQVNIFDWYELKIART